MVNVCARDMLLLTFLLLGAINYGDGYDISSTQLSYLQDYGYFPRPKADVRALKTQESVKEAVVKFQEFVGLPVTGEIDDATMRMFRKPRCGLRDMNDGDDDDDDGERRRKRFAVKGLRWKRKVLTYQIENWTNDLPKPAVAKAIKKALGKWQAASNLQFHYQRNGRADIMIKFARKTHGDEYKFDGPGGIIAHAFFPGSQHLAGDTHFDDDETFTLGTSRGRNFDWVALHEFGHAIGLDHNRIRGAIMYPLYEGYKGNDIHLHDDDVKGIQFLYGVPKGYQPRVNSPIPEIDVDENGCVNIVRTVSANSALGAVHVINGDRLYIYDMKNLAQKTKTPKSMKGYFREDALTDIDAVYNLPNGRTVYLKGDRSWEYKGRKVVRGNIPVSRRGFTTDMHDVDAAFYWSKAKKVYIFKGKRYWRYDPWQRSVDNGYPKMIRDSWVNVPDNIDSVFEWENNVFFFKGEQYYRFDVNEFIVVENYPKYIAERFFKCEQTPQVSRLVANNEQLGVRQSVSASQTMTLGLNMFILPYLVIMYIVL